MKRTLVLVCVALTGSGCAYLGTWAKQSYYSFQLRHSPRQRTSKHLLDRENFFVFGKVAGAEIPSATAVAVLALSSAPVAGEIVDIGQSVRCDSYYGLNLPPGEYRLVAAADLNGDGVCTEQEVIAERSVRLDEKATDKILGNYNLDARNVRRGVPPNFRIAVQREPDPTPSVFYPKGTIRALADPIFSPRMASLGLYEPAAFLEVAPMMFYALEEELGYKVPVIFVHGIGGSARDFADIVARLDRRRYRAWFFHYPSGGDLRQLSAMFYEIFLSGNTMPRPDCPVVLVAHSMGGLVVREALNRWRGTPREAALGGLVTIASPLGGHPAAARAAHAPVVIPSWRNLDPGSDFIHQLHRTPLPDGLVYQLIYTSGAPRTFAFGEPGDGVVPLASQRSRAALGEATEQIEFKCGHAEVLHEPTSVAGIVRLIEAVKSPFPADHLRAFDRGGYARPLPESEFSALDAYFVRNLGHYLDALVGGEIQPIHPSQAEFVQECRGHRKPDTPASKAWIKLNRLYPDRTPREQDATRESRRSGSPR